MPRLRALHWADVDPYLAGPLSTGRSGPGRTFRAPEVPPDFRIVRIFSGEAWPAGLDPLDRLASAPIPLGRPGAAPDDRDVVLHAELESETRPLVTRLSDGDVAWAGDPASWIGHLLSESYVTSWVRNLPSRVPFINYNRAPHWLKGLLERVQSPARATLSRPVGFPIVPLDDLVERIRALCHNLAYDGAPPRGGFWPEARAAAATVTHDVDTAWILEDARHELLREIVETESRLGFRGAWFVTAQRLDIRRHGRALELLAGAGHEIGAHGWSHDAKLEYLGERAQDRRMQRAKARCAPLRGSGVRTPWYCRSEQLFGVLEQHFAWDSSVPNASGFFTSQSNSGCCSLLPYRPRPGLIELPMTLPPDTALDEPFGYDALLELADSIIDSAGVVVATLHPQPHQSANDAGLSSWFGFLGKLSEREIWCETPGAIIRHYTESIEKCARAAPG